MLNFSQLTLEPATRYASFPRLCALLIYLLKFEYPGVRQWIRKVASDFGWDWVSSIMRNKTIALTLSIGSGIPSKWNIQTSLPCHIA